MATDENRLSTLPVPLVSGGNIGFRAAGRVVLEHVDIAVASREIVTLIGPNGAGKSTLVKILLGLVRPDEGHVSRKSDLCVGYLPQKLRLDPVMPLPVRRLMRLTGKPSASRIMAALAETGVPHLVHAQVHTLSGGELQRVLLARALLREPDLLVLDEPLQGVDFSGQAELYELIAHIRDERGCGILMVSHDLHLVMAAADRVLCLNRHLCCAGAPAAVARDPEYLRLFGPRAAEAFAIYAHGHDHDHDVSGAVVPMASDDPLRELA